MNKIKKEDFFREITVRICSSLDIKTALENVFEYLKKYIPLDNLILGICDLNLSAIRVISDVTTGRIEPFDEIIPVPKDLWAQIISSNRREPFIINSLEERNEKQRALFTLLNKKYVSYSEISLPIWIEDKNIGFLLLRVKGENKYSYHHSKLIESISEPIAIALANALAHEKLLHYRDTLIDDNQFLKNELHPLMVDEIIGSNSGLRNVLEMVRQVASLSNSVLLLGETGTGKEVIANAIHYTSSRKDGPFIKVNCGSIPETLIDSELFGHEKGAFTGAVSEKRGRFERADGGTIFLDEIGELPQQAQIRLLRVLQTREIERVGGSSPIKIDIRVIAATHRNLEGMVSENHFREDLWFRLNVFPIVVPPLRQRKKDIPSLARHFVSKKSLELGISSPPVIAPGALQQLLEYEWPGNVRELENVIERELIRHRGQLNKYIDFDSLLPIRKKQETGRPQEETNSPIVLNLNAVSAAHIRTVLKMTKGKIHGPNGAANLLGINANTLRGRMNKLGIKYGRRKSTITL